MIAMLPVLLLVACGGETDDRTKDMRSEPEFASHARDVFAELQQEPLDTTLGTEIGLFGDLTVGSDELVVMRQFRYRVDTTSFGRLGRMAFQVRDAERRYEPIPVFLTFASREGLWRLERAEYGRAVADSAEGGGGHVSGNTAAPAAEPKTPLYGSLRARLDPWLDAALARVDSMAM